MHPSSGRTVAIQIAIAIAICPGGPVACGGVASPSGPDPGGADAGGDPGVDAASDGGMPTSCADASGSRLRWRFRQIGRNAEQRIGLHDTELDWPCSFQRDGAGGIRCLPDPTRPPFSSATLIYRDIACTDEALLFGAPPPGTHVAFTVPAAGCGAATFRYFEIGAALGDLGGTTLYTPSGRTCAAIVAPSGFYHEPAAELLPDAFVEGTRLRAGAGRLLVTETDGADGSRHCLEPGPLHDAELDAPCESATAEDGTTRCLPLGGRADRLYRDPRCGDPLAVTVAVDGCDAGEYAVETMSGLCRSPRRIHTLGDPVTDPLFAGAPGTCTAYAPSPGTTVRSLPSVVPAERFAEVSSSCPSTGDRLDPCVLSTADGLEVRAEDWWDARLGVMCRFGAAGDGSLRCMPVVGDRSPVATVMRLYRDPACTEEGSFVAALGTDVCSSTVPELAIDLRDPGRTHVVEVRDAQGGAFYWNVAGCGLIPIGAVVYQVGDELPAEEFAAAGAVEIE